MKREGMEAWLRTIYETQEVEISCTDCFDLVSGLVEAEAGGWEPGADGWRVKQHLEQCRACRDEYQSLRELRLVEESTGLPSLDDLQNSIL